MTNRLSGESALERQMRGLSWENTLLGAPDTWPQSLKSALGICLNSRFPIAIYWGPQLALLYNDAWSPILGEKHPWALGRPGREVWPEIWPEIGPLFEAVQQGGEGVWQQDQLLPMRRHGYTEECYFNFTFSPIRGEDGDVAGIFNAVIETTFRVIEERRTRVLRELSERLAGAQSEAEVCLRAAEVLGASPADVPFCLFYLSEQGTSTLRLAAAAGPPLPEQMRSASIDIDDRSLPWPAASVWRSARAAALDRLGEQFGVSLPSSIWPEPVERALVVPIANAQGAEPVGLLIAGLSPRRALDDAYHTFIERVSLQVVAALGNARAYEAERRRAEALAAIDEAKTAFFSNVSHEFRTPLTLLLGPLEDTLAEADALPVEARERLNVAHRNALRLLKLVNTLLDFSRIEAGRAQASYQPTDLAAYTADLASVFRATIERAGLSLIVDCPPLPEPVYVDREMWEKIVFNLLSNAFKFTFVGEIEVALRRAGAAAELLVRDTGIGIPPDEMPHLFERFHRVRAARGRTFEGSGIGLALVQELVRLHGGAVAVQSDENRGTTFTISIPTGAAHLPAERTGKGGGQAATHAWGQIYVEEALHWLPGGGSPAPTTRPGATPAPPARLLVVDDNADMREYMGRLLSPAYAVVAVSDGAAALRAIHEQQFDLVLTDVMMPHVDGFGLLAALRADERTRTLPVILLSARAGEEARAEGMEAGADDYLVKPFSARELLARIDAHVMMMRLRREAAERERALREEAEGRLRAAEAAERALAERERILDILLKVSDTAREMHDEEGIARTACQLVKDATRATRCSCGFVYPEEDRLLVLADIYDGQGGAPCTEGEWPLSGFGPELVALHSGGEPVVIEDTAAHPATAAHQSTFDRIHTRSLISVPLLREGQVIAYFSIHDRAPRRFSAVEVSLLRDVAVRVWEAIQRSRAEADLQAAQGQRLAEEQQHAARLQQLNAVSLGINAAPNRDELLRQITHGARALIGARRAVVTLLVHADGAAGSRVVSVAPGAEPQRDPGHAADERIVRLVDDGGRALRLSREELIEDPAWLGADDAALPPPNGILAAPLIDSTGAGVAVIELSDKVDGAFTAADEALLQQLAQMAAVAIENHTLYEHEQAVRAQAEEASRLKDEFLTTVSHELRTPLTAFLGYAQMLQRRKRDEAYVARAAEKMVRSAKDQAQLIEDLLDVSRIVSGKLRIEPRPTDLIAVIHDAVDTVRAAVEAKGLQLQLDLDPAASMIIGDATRLQQVVWNLLLNATKFTPPGGSIVVRLEPKGRDARLSVSDTGQGIRPSFLPFVFDRFRQADSTSNRFHGGLGLGLSIVRHLVELHGGTVQADSRGEGQGATFTVCLPLASAGDGEAAAGRAAGEEAGHDESPSELRGLRVLIVDDQPDILDLLQDVLTGAGAVVRACEAAGAALEAVQTWRPDVIVSDIAMPDEDGYWLIRSLRALPAERGGATPAIALTAYVRAEEQVRVLAAGFQLYVPKPVEPGELRAAIAHLAREA